MKIIFPEHMRAVRQHHADGPLVLETLPVPRPGHGEVLIRMEASPINPSDLSLLKGGYLRRSYPFTPGLEGSGTVLKSGGGLLAGWRVGKRVACSPDPEGDGTWAEYMKASVMRTVPLPASISMEQGAMMLVNPMTAMALLQMAREGKHKALVNNAAASSLGKMLIRLARSRDVPLINIVRKEEQLEELREIGAGYVLNSSASSFASAFKELCAELEATLILDALGGEQSRSLLGSAPPGARLINYARLSGDILSVDSTDLMLHGKQVSGFQLGHWLGTKSIPFKLGFIRQVKRELGKTLYSEIAQIYPLEQVEAALQEYKNRSSAGKILLKIFSPVERKQTE
jgi:NADPH:quinone reductase-like Zn-dependent oxidoreductase